MFFAEYPADWGRCLGVFAWLFHFQPSELAEFDRDAILFWKEQAEYIQEELSSGKSN